MMRGEYKMRFLTKIDINKILEEHELWLDSLGVKGKRADLTNVSLYSADLSNANLYRANLYKADLTNANLYRANLYKADLLHTNLYRANLSHANLYNADLSNANLYNANLYNADLTNANLYNANLTNADLSNTNLSYNNLLHANLSNANLSNANLYKATLSNANLYEVRNKEIVTFQFKKHFAYYCDGFIKIGCMYMSKEDWLKVDKEVAIKKGYSELESQVYSDWIKMINKRFK